MRSAFDFLFHFEIINQSRYHKFSPRGKLEYWFRLWESRFQISRIIPRYPLKTLAYVSLEHMIRRKLDGSLAHQLMEKQRHNIARKKEEERQWLCSVISAFILSPFLARSLQIKCQTILWEPASMGSTLDQSECRLQGVLPKRLRNPLRSIFKFELFQTFCAQSFCLEDLHHVAIS